MRLEYRLLNSKTGQYEPFLKYDNIDTFEALGRQMCNFFVKEGVVYQRVSNTKEYGIHIIYLDPTDEEIFDDAKIYQKVGVEFREFVDDEVDSPFLNRWECHDHETAFVDILMKDEIDIFENGEYWRHVDTDLDEDRLTYVVYVKAQTDYHLEEEK